MTDNQVRPTDPQIADWLASCPNCAAAPRLTHSILDSRRGTTVRLYHCSECGNRLWDDGPGGVAAATKGPDSSAAVRLTVAPEALLHDFAHRFDLLGSCLVFLDDRLGRKLANLGRSFAMADVFRDRRGWGPWPVVDSPDVRPGLLHDIADLIFEPADIEGPRRCILRSHRVNSFGHSRSSGVRYLAAISC